MLRSTAAVNKFLFMNCRPSLNYRYKEGKNIINIQVLHPLTKVNGDTFKTLNSVNAIKPQYIQNTHRNQTKNNLTKVRKHKHKGG